jgi:hypothetical protein
MPKLEGYDVHEIGVAWYSSGAWRELCALPEAGIEKSYSEYLRSYERMSADFAAQGIRAVKVPIDIALMIKWCHAHGYEIDGRGRAAFGAALQLAQVAGKDVLSMEFHDNTRTKH